MNGARRDRRAEVAATSLLVVFGTVVAGTVAGCGGSPEPAAQAVDVAAYTVVIDDFLPEAAPDDRPVVFITHLDDEPIPLDDQVAVIEANDETHDVRFVDRLAAAVDTADDRAPPREDGLVVGIGDVPRDAPHVVRVEVYRDRDRIDAQLVTLADGPGGWRVVAREAVTPEALVHDAEGLVDDG